MLKMIGVLVVVAVLAGALAWYQGWFHVSGTNADGSSNVTFGLDKDKVKSDLGRSEDKLEEAADALGDRLTQLKERATHATAAKKGDLDTLIDKLEGERKELVAKLKDLKDATSDRAKTIAGEIRESIDRLRAKVDRAIDDLKS